jgi:hypothetical protein
MLQNALGYTAIQSPVLTDVKADIHQGSSEQGNHDVTAQVTGLRLEATAERTGVLVFQLLLGVVKEVRHTSFYRKWTVLVDTGAWAECFEDGLQLRRSLTVNLENDFQLGDFLRRKRSSVEPYTEHDASAKGDQSKNGVDAHGQCSKVHQPHPDGCPESHSPLSNTSSSSLRE